MGFLDLLMVASMPPLQVLLIAMLGAFLATEYCGILTADARRNLNKIVFYVFTPSLMFGTLARTMTLQDIISWWFMPVNIGMIFLCGHILGWIVVKMLRPERHLEGLIIASCSAGNLGNLMLIIVPAVCDEVGSPFGSPSTCRSLGLSYASFSMALGGFFIWTHTYSLMKGSGALYNKSISIEEGVSKTLAPNKDLDSNGTSLLLKVEDGEEATSDKNSSSISENHYMQWWLKIKGIAHQVAEELLAPPTCSAIVGFVVGAMPWLKSLIIGAAAPLRVVEDSIKLLGDGTIPSVTLILGGNLIKGMRKSKLRPSMVIAVIAVRYLVLPGIGIAVVKGASELGFLPKDPLFNYVLMTQFTLPPAMNIGTMAELFGVGQEECSVLFLWTYVIAAIALTVWSTVFMWILA